MGNIKYLPLGGIETEGLQIRVKMDQDVILDYADAMKAGKKFPPLLTFFDGESYFLADGFHRLHAAKELSLLKIACEVRDGTRADARLAACGANQEHGLQRKNQDKRQAVKVVLELRPEWSNRMIAEHVGVHHDMVGERRQLADSASSNVRNPRQSTGFGPPPTPPQRIGLDGKFRNAPPVKEPPPVPESPAESAGNEAIGLVDAFGRHVPEDLAPLWHRRQEVQDALTAISRVRSTIRNAQESQDPLWTEINFSSALALLDRVYTEVDSTKPYVVCPMCQGIGCRACKERGLLGKYRYETVIPRELKGRARDGVAGGVA